MRATPAWGEVFSAQGSISFEYYKNGERVNSRSHTFRVVSDACKTLITTFPETKSGAIQSFEYGTEGDGNSVTLIRNDPAFRAENITRFKNGKKTIVPLKEPLPLNQKGMLTVQPTQVPPYNYGLITPIWIAFAGHCHWSASREYSSKPLFYFSEPAYRDILDREQFLDEIKVRQMVRHRAQRNSLIDEMVEFRSGLRYFHDGEELLSKPLPEPYSVETTNAFFRVSSWTNFSDFELPSKFVLTKYTPDFKNGATPRLLRQAEWIGEVESVTITNYTGSFLPSIPDSVRVTDYRMPVEETGVAAIIYDSDSQRVLEVSEVRKLDAFERKVKKHLALKPEQLQKILVLLLLLTLIPVGVFFIFFRNRKMSDE